MIATIFGNIKKYAEIENISITNLEKAAGLGNGTIGKWQKCIPKIDKLAAVAKCLDVTIDDLLKEEEE